MGENEKKLAGVIMWNEAAEKFKDVQDTSDTAIINQQLVESYFGDLSAKKILDIGCGYGWYSNIFRQKGAEVVGCDGADKMIELARENYPECKFELVDIQKKLPYKDESFDMVFCNQVLMDIEDIDIVQSEISRVLKNHGTYFWGIVHPAFYFGEWNLDSKGCRVSRNVSHYTKNFKFLHHFSGIPLRFLPACHSHSRE